LPFAMHDLCLISFPKFTEWSIFKISYLLVKLLQLLGWLAASPFILGTLYIVFLPCFRILVRKFSTVPLSPKKPLLSHSEIRLKVRDV
jgi:hypothetical protein